MHLPSPEQYRSAVQHPDVAFAEDPELAASQAESNRHGIPSTYSGNFTATFHLRGAEREWAVRCYTREIGFVGERYAAISHFLESSPDEAFTMARLVPGGIVVEGARYDIIRMDWIDGSLLNEYVEHLVQNGDTAKIASLAEALLDLGLRLERLGIAHGDIQHGNVLVDRAGRLRLVDYDDLFLPELAHLGFANGIGQENYQHPQRDSGRYDAALDRFAFVSLYVTLRALAQAPQLWDDFDGGEDCLLFRKNDFLDPRSSQLFRRLDTIAPIKEFVDRFASICCGTYEEVPTLRAFIDGRFRYGRYVPIAAKTRPIMPPPPRIVASSPDATPTPPRPLSPVARAVGSLRRVETLLALVSIAVILVMTTIGLLLHRPSAKPPAPLRIAARTPRPTARATVTPPPATPRPRPRPTATPRAQPAPTPIVRILPAPARATRAPLPTAAPTATPRPQTPQPAATPLCAAPNAPPHVIALASPPGAYDATSSAAGRSVIVAVDVSAAGSVIDAAVKQSSNDVTLDFTALAIARHSSYAPAENNCKAEPGSLDVTVTY